MWCIFIVKITSTIIFIYICISTYNVHIPIHIHVRVHIHIHCIYKYIHIYRYICEQLCIYIYYKEKEREREEEKLRHAAASSKQPPPSTSLPLVSQCTLPRDDTTDVPPAKVLLLEGDLVGVTIIDCAKDGGYPSTYLQNQCNKWKKDVDHLSKEAVIHQPPIPSLKNHPIPPFI
jgi:hypothetical protein